MNRYNAPALCFVAGRSFLLPWLLRGAIVLAALGLCAWGVAGADKSVSQWLGAALLCWGCSAAAQWQLRRLPQGSLLWDGQAWYWQGQGEQAQPVQPRLCFDGQRVLLLQLPALGWGRQWLWLERAMQPDDWLALRRALYSRPRQGGRADQRGSADSPF